MPLSLVISEKEIACGNNIIFLYSRAWKLW